MPVRGPIIGPNACFRRNGEDSQDAKRRPLDDLDLVLLQVPAFAKVTGEERKPRKNQRRPAAEGHALMNQGTDPRCAFAGHSSHLTCARVPQGAAISMPAIPASAGGGFPAGCRWNE